MVITTREQRVALKRIFDRAPIFPLMTTEEFRQGLKAVPITYKQFRRGLQPTFGCDNAVTIKWAGMWLCIERDGYTHS